MSIFKPFGDWVPRSSLPKPIQHDLVYLENALGFKFDDGAYKVKLGARPSYTINGIDPEGDEVAYERWETGRKYIWIKGERYRPQDLKLPYMESPEKYRNRLLEEFYGSKSPEKRIEIGLGGPLGLDEFSMEESDRLLDLTEGLLELHTLKGKEACLTEEERKKLEDAVKEYTEKWKESRGLKE
jgi:hypothetical protein